MKIIREEYQKAVEEAEAQTTEKYDDDPALKGDQDELPDQLQKGIIDKAEKGSKKIKENAAGKLTLAQIKSGAEEAGVSVGEFLKMQREERKKSSQSSRIVSMSQEADEMEKTLKSMKLKDRYTAMKKKDAKRLAAKNNKVKRVVITSDL